MRLTPVTAPALAATLMLSASACGDDTGTPDSARDSAAPTAEPSPSTTPDAAEPVRLIDLGDEPTVRASFKRAALRAVDDDLITMVPSVLPDGWTTVGGGYDPDPQWWRMEFTAPTGDVTLDQLPGTADEVLSGQKAMESQDDVDLSAWGTGTWTAWEHRGASVLTHDLKGSTVVLQGADPETVRSLAESLLPAEDAAEQED